MFFKKYTLNIYYYNSMKDSFLHKGLRKKLVDDLVKKGIKNDKVLNAIMQIPRHLFLDNAFVNFAYQDKAFPIGSGQTISQPYTVAFQTELLDVKPFHKVLEIGTGSGYQAAVLDILEAQVFTIERQRDLFKKLKNFCLQLDITACLFTVMDIKDCQNLHHLIELLLHVVLHLFQMN